MKFILLTMCLLPLLAVAQDCKVLRETDPYTKETRISSGFMKLQGASVTVDADNKEIDFFFTINDKCFNGGNTVVIYYEGTKQKSTYRNTGSMNCDGYFHFNFKNGELTPLNLQKLSSQKVTQFIFSGDDKKQTVISLLPDQQQALMNAVTCVIKEGKTLIK